MAFKNYLDRISISWNVENNIISRGRDYDALKKKIWLEGFIGSSRISGKIVAGLAEHFEKNLEIHCLESDRLFGQILAGFCCRTIFLLIKFSSFDHIWGFKTHFSFFSKLTEPFEREKKEELHLAISISCLNLVFQPLILQIDP